MLRPDPRTLALENDEFLRALRQTGNIKTAAAAIGRHPMTMHKRRRRDPSFATEWRAAEVVAAARLHDQVKGRAWKWDEAPRDAYRTKGGEQVIMRGRGGRLIQRAAAPNRLTRACEQAFLLALSATCNVGLAAAAAGAPREQFYARRRKDEAFAREWRLALAEGYATLELRCMAATDPESYQHDAWRYNEPPAPPPATVAQMLQLLYLHQKEARLLAEPAYLKRRRGETHEAYSLRLGAMHHEREQRDREQCRLGEAVRAARGEPTRFEWEQIALPDLAQVHATRADPAKTPHDPDMAMFGGWRIKHLRRSSEAEGGSADGAQGRSAADRAPRDPSRRNRRGR